ncbi:MAG TPA: 50S ribosomal protein L32 [Acidimicrobiia bacterium]
MPVPKRRMSRSRTRHRRAQWRGSRSSLVSVAVAGQTYRVPRRLVAAVKRGYVDPRTWIQGS